MKEEFVDVLIVGSGISGIGAGAHLSIKCPTKKYLILEGRDNFGGTWDLFKYPGVRSDSDMHTLGFSFKPWVHRKSIADGASIMEYLAETIQEYGLTDKIRYKHYVHSADWSSSENLWTLTVENKETGETKLFKSSFLYMCAGYYSYKGGYKPEFKGKEEFRGDIIHPQEWPEDFDYEGKNIIVIGSGATAATLVPAMSKKAKHVTMLQRSPTYIASAPDEDAIALFLAKILPRKIAYRLIRLKNIFYSQWIYRRAKATPGTFKQILLDRLKKELPTNYDVKKHFTPSYDPWEQRLCLVPNSDLFKAIRQNDVSVVTDQIEKFNHEGIELKSGKVLKADVIITATGIVLENFGGIDVKVDDSKINISDTLTYKSMMYSGIPNFVNSFGYLNASWTLKADITSEYVCRIIKHMDENNFKKCCPEIPSDVKVSKDWVEGWSSGYIQRSIHKYPKQGNKEPWLNNQDYLKDWLNLQFGTLEDGSLQFSNKRSYYD
jgi:monooxygenase